MAKVLLIEDDKIQADIYLTRLLTEGYSATWAKDGEEGLKMALENHPSIIVLDLKMPKLNGLEVLEELRKEEWGKNVPIIILTSLDPTDEITNSISKNNASFFLLKQNTEPEDLIRYINEILENPPTTTSL